MQITAENQVDTLIVHRITDYLERHDKVADAQVLRETVDSMRHTVLKDLMQPRDTRAGKESNTLYSGPCARKSRLTYDGAEREPLRSRTVLKFLLGDLVELSVLAVARLAGCQIDDNNIDLSIMGHDRVNIPVHPDGRYTHIDETQYNVEIKSCDSKTFDRWMEQGGPDDTWGYLTQASIEVAAWREYGRDINGTLFLAVSTGSRQGSLAEFYKPYDPALVAAWHERRRLALAGPIPLVPFTGQPEIKFVRGKELKAEDIIGNPTPRINEKGSIYGWDIPTGRQVVPVNCTYCDFMQHHCWPYAELEMEGSKPVWVVPSVPKSASLEVGNVSRQFLLASTVEEWNAIYAGWKAEEQFHTEDERTTIKQVADEAKKRLSKSSGLSRGAVL